MNERTNISISPLSPSSNTLSLHNTWNPFITCKYCGAWLDTVEPRKPCKNSRINSHALPGTTQGLYSTYSTQTDKSKEGNNFTHWESCAGEMKIFPQNKGPLFFSYKLSNSNWKREQMEIIDKIVNVIRSKVSFHVVGQWDTKKAWARMTFSLEHIRQPSLFSFDQLVQPVIPWSKPLVIIRLHIHYMYLYTEDEREEFLSSFH